MRINAQRQASNLKLSPTWAHELTSHGKRAAVDIHRGVSQHTNGFYNVLGWYTVNALLGNYDWQGGMSALKTYSYDGKKGGPFDLPAVPGKIPPFGVSIIRHGVSYDKTTIFEGYPSKRNWYPLARNTQTTFFRPYLP